MLIVFFLPEEPGICGTMKGDLFLNIKLINIIIIIIIFFKNQWNVRSNKK